jgi:hypothetical protein
MVERIVIAGVAIGGAVFVIWQLWLEIARLM